MERSPQPVDEELLEAYRRTSYVAALPQGEVRIRIGEPQPALAGTAAFLTAENPGSEKLSPEVNGLRTLELARVLRSYGWNAFPARAIPDQPGWEVENGFLILDVPLHEVLDLGRAYGQNAIVFVGAAQPSRLVLCFPG